MTLAEFILQRIAEDEAAAQAAVGEAVFQSQTGRWSFETVRDQFGPIPIVFAVADGGGKTQVANLEAAWEREARGRHIARHDPARVLAECEAKRRIVELHHPHDHGGGHGDAVFCDECQWDHGDDSPRIDNQPVEGFGNHPCRTLVLLAAVYADHPAYREEWRP